MIGRKEDLEQKRSGIQQLPVSVLRPYGSASPFSMLFIMSQYISKGTKQSVVYCMWRENERAIS